MDWLAPGRIRSGSSMTCRRGCGHTTTSSHQMWSEPGVELVLSMAACAGPRRCDAGTRRQRFHALIMLGLSMALAGTAHAQSALADRIQAGDRKAALEMIAAGANVNQTQLDGTTPLQWATYRVDSELV